MSPPSVTTTITLRPSRPSSSRAASQIASYSEVPASPLIPRSDRSSVDALRVKFPSVLVYDIAGKGFTRFHGVPTMENVQLTTGENVAVNSIVAGALCNWSGTA